MDFILTGVPIVPLPQRRRRHPQNTRPKNTASSLSALPLSTHEPKTHEPKTRKKKRNRNKKKKEEHFQKGKQTKQDAPTTTTGTAAAALQKQKHTAPSASAAPPLTLPPPSQSKSKKKPLPKKKHECSPTHFLSFRLPDPVLRAQCEKVQKHIVKRDPSLSAAVTSSLKLHLTLFVLTLKTEEEIVKAKDLLQQVVQRRSSGSGSKSGSGSGSGSDSGSGRNSTKLPRLTLSGLSVFNSGTVLFVDVAKDEQLADVIEFVNMVHTAFVNAKLLPPDKKHTFKAHVTLLKTSQLRRRKRRKKGVNKQDHEVAQEKNEQKQQEKIKIKKVKIVAPEEYVDTSFGEHELTELELCEMKTDSSGYYVVADVALF